MTDEIQGTITNQTGKTHRVHFPSITVLGLARHNFSSSSVTKRGIISTLEAGNPHRKKSGVAVQPEQQSEDRGSMFSFKVDLLLL